MDKGHLERHMWYHKDKQTSAYPECDYGGNGLRERMLSHKREECIMCSECEYTCASGAEFEAYMMITSCLDFINSI